MRETILVKDVLDVYFGFFCLTDVVVFRLRSWEAFNLSISSVGSALD